MTDQRERGPDPIARWLGDDQPKPEPGRFRYEDSAEFLAELNSLITETGEFEYDGVYSQRYAAREVSQVSLRDVDGNVVATGVQDETGQFYGTTLPTLRGSSRWRYVANCSCRRCELRRGNRPPRQVNPEWRQAAESYAPSVQPPRQPPRLRSWTDVREDVRTIRETLRVSTNEGWDADRHEYNALLRAVRGRDDETQVRRLTEYYRMWYGVTENEPNCDCTSCGLVTVRAELVPIRSGTNCEVTHWRGMNRIIRRRVLRELNLPDDWQPTYLRLLRDMVVRIDVTITPAMENIITGARRVREAITELSDVVRDDPFAHDRWADDGGTIGMVDY